MPRPTSHALVLLSLWLLAACRTTPNPEYCDAENDQCAMTGLGWTCDMGMNRCVPPPGAACTGNGDCERPAEPICDVGAEPAACRGCMNGTECEERSPDTPICSSNGECIDGCRNLVDCNRANPICDTSTGVCGPCTGTGPDDTCMARDDGANYCNGSSCVECLDNTHCNEARPICDGTNTCAVCKEHSDCAAYSGVCGDDGACAAEAAVVYVRQMNSADTNDCSKGSPCTTIGRALMVVGGDTENKKFIRILDSANYSENLTLNGVTVSIIGNDGTRITGGIDNQPTISVGAASTIALETLTIRSTGINANGLQCGSGNSHVRLERIIVNDNEGIGVNISGGCELVLERSVIAGNLDGGIKLVDAPFTIANNYILNNGDVSSLFGGIQIFNGVTATPQVFAFNTILNNDASTTADTRGVDCDLPGASPLTATGNILRGGSGGVALLKRDNCNWDHSNIEGLPQELMDGTNIDDATCLAAPDQNGVARLSGGTPCDNAAAPVEGVIIDYDGDDRSAETPDMGADELMP
jgi:hypothetical protein